MEEYRSDQAAASIERQKRKERATRAASRKIMRDREARLARAKDQFENRKLQVYPAPFLATE